MKYYYLSPEDPDTIQAILTEGIFANPEGEILIFENKPITDKITGSVNTSADCFAQKLNLMSYAMFEIDFNGITGNTYPERPTKGNSKFKIVLVQLYVDPHFITLFGIFSNDYSQLRSHKTTQRRPSVTIREKPSVYYANIHSN